VLTFVKTLLIFMSLNSIYVNMDFVIISELLFYVNLLYLLVKISK
jgi:hypothetical protein